MSSAGSGPDPSQMQGMHCHTSTARQATIAALNAQGAGWRARIGAMHAEEVANTTEDMAKAADATIVHDKLAAVTLSNSALRTTQANEYNALQLQHAGMEASMKTAAESALASKVACSKVDVALVKQIQAATTASAPKLQERATRHGSKR